MVDQIDIMIRLATEADLPDLEWDGEYRHFRRLYRQAMRDARRGNRALLVAEIEGQIVGQLFVQYNLIRSDLINEAHSAYLHAFRVRPAYRNLRVGTRLMQTAETHLIDRGYRRALIAVAQDNPDARRLYERLGYRFYAEDPGVWSYIDDQGRMKHVREPAFILEKYF